MLPRHPPSSSEQRPRNHNKAASTVVQSASTVQARGKRPREWYQAAESDEQSLLVNRLEA